MLQSFNFTTPTETEYYNQNASEQLNETNIEVSLEVQLRTTAAYEYWKGNLTTQGQNRRSCFVKTLAGILVKSVVKLVYRKTDRSSPSKTIPTLATPSG